MAEPNLKRNGLARTCAVTAMARLHAAKEKELVFRATCFAPVTMANHTSDFNFDLASWLGPSSVAMAPLRRKEDSGAPAARASGGTPDSGRTAPARSGKRKWTLRLAAMILPPLLLLAALEMLLWLLGYGYPTSFLLSSTVNGQKVLVENQKFGWRFFGKELARTPYPISLPEIKPPGTIRIFVFGESAAYGDPQPDVGLPRMLAVLLRNRYPDTRFEIVNAAMVAINSNVILPITLDCARHNGDIWVIYMGNNEVVGPFGSGTVFGWRAPGLTLIRATLALKTTRTGEWLGELSQKLRTGNAAPAEWRGMTMFLRNQVRQDDPRMAVVYSHFAKNLDDITRAGREAGAKVVVSTMACNLRDCAPFGSLHRPDLAPAELEEWQRDYDAGAAAEQTGSNTEAVALFAKAGQLDDQFADLQFRWGRGCLALGQDEEASRHFTRARDEDTLRFRADTRINEIIRQHGAGREKEGILVADAETDLSAQSPHQLPGNELFYEHVHFTFEGNYLLARALAGQVALLLPEKVTRLSGKESKWLTEAECERQLVWTDWNRYRTLKLLPLNTPPFTYQLDHAQKMRDFNRQLSQLSSASRPEALGQTLEDYRQAVARAPEDWVFWKNLGELQGELADFNGAGESFRRIEDLLPHEADGFLECGLVLIKLHRLDEADHEFRVAHELDEEKTRATLVKQDREAAEGAFQKGNVTGAILMSRNALELEPYSTESLLNLAKVLFAAGKDSEAQEQLRIALKHPPGTMDELTGLGQACLREGWTNEARTSFEEALHIDAADPDAHLGLADALAAAGRLSEAQPHYIEAVRLAPDSVAAHLNWGLALLEMGKSAQALAQFSEVLRLDPGNAEAQKLVDTISEGRPPSNR